MRFCSNCGSSRIHQTIPEGDNRPRFFCPDCQITHYQNPNMVVGCIAEKEGKILLAKRNIEPRKGYWNLPCGFLEMNETVEEGAMREVWEETGAEVDILDLHTVYNLPHAQQVYLIFSAKVTNQDLEESTPESEVVRFFEPDQIPWTEMAFSSNTFALIRYLEDQKQGNEKGVHIGTFRKGI